MSLRLVIQNNHNNRMNSVALAFFVYPFYECLSFDKSKTTLWIISHYSVTEKLFCPFGFTCIECIAVRVRTRIKALSPRKIAAVN